jgi:outer membrane protein assembly factor BamD (BamD/ComL family)
LRTVEQDLLLDARDAVDAGRYTEALRSLRRLLQEHGDTPAGRAALTEAAYALGRAVSEGDLSPEILAELDARAQTLSGYRQGLALHALALAHWVAGDADAALASANAMIASFAGASGPSEAHYLSGLALKADLLLATGDVAGAGGAVEALLLAEPDSRAAERAALAWRAAAEASGEEGVRTADVPRRKDAAGAATRMSSELPTESGLGVPYPNPAREAVTVPVAVAAGAHAEVALYDLLGRRLGRVHAGRLGPGQHEVEVVLGALPPGLYVLRGEVTGAAGAVTLSHRLVTVAE